MAAYCTLPELRDLGLNPDAFEDILAPRKTEKIKSRSDYIDGFLAARFVLPLIAWGDDIKRACAVLVSVDLIRGRGVSPDDGADLGAEEDRVNAWLKLVAAGVVSPRVTDSTPGATPGQSVRSPRVVSSSSRGLSVRGTTNPRGPFQGD